MKELAGYIVIPALSVTLVCLVAVAALGFHAPTWLAIPAVGGTVVALVAEVFYFFLPEDDVRP